jgi:hypothetical protein
MSELNIGSLDDSGMTSDYDDVYQPVIEVAELLFLPLGQALYGQDFRRQCV